MLEILQIILLFNIKKIEVHAKKILNPNPPNFQDPAAKISINLCFLCNNVNVIKRKIIWQHYNSKKNMRFVTAHLTQFV